MCYNPITIKTEQGYRKVPCGHCLECLRKYQNDWSNRMYEELKAHDGKAVFFTLTYDDNNVPKNYLFNNTVYHSKSDYGYNNVYIDDNGKERVFPSCRGERKHKRELPQMVLTREFGLSPDDMHILDFNIKRSNHKEFLKHVSRVFGDYLRLVDNSLPSCVSPLGSDWSMDDVEKWFDSYEGDLFEFEEVDTVNQGFSEIIDDDDYLDSLPVNFDARERPVMSFNSVRSEDVQNWIKRARQRRVRMAKKSGEPVQEFSFFITSEYGPRTLRPHYHGVLFGVSAAESIDMMKDWQKHHGVRISWEDVDLSKGDMSYCAKYCSKGMYEHPLCSKDFFYTHADGTFTEYHSKDYERCIEIFGINEPIVDPTFHLVSKGLGVSYVHQNKERFTVNFKDIDFERTDVSPTIAVERLEPASSLLNVPSADISVIDNYTEVKQLSLDLGFEVEKIYYDLGIKIQPEDREILKANNIKNYEKSYDECIEKLFNDFKYKRPIRKEIVTYGMPKYYRSKVLNDGLRVALANYVQQRIVADYQEKFEQFRACYSDREDAEIVLALEREEQEALAQRKLDAKKRFTKHLNKSQL